MGYCRKNILRGALIRALIPSLLCIWFLWMGLHWMQTQQQLNATYEEQAQVLGMDAPLVQLDFDETADLFYGCSILMFALIAALFVPVFFPQNTKLVKSILRYEKYEGEGNIDEMICEVDRDVRHAPTFGSIKIGEKWIAGRTGMTKNGAVYREDICAAFFFHMEKRGRGASGIPTASKEYALVLLDGKMRDTILVSVWEKNIMAAYRLLCRHHPEIIRGDLDDYIAFLAQSPEEQERAFAQVKKQKYANKNLSKF